jgi:hypothetical protein
VEKVSETNARPPSIQALVRAHLVSKAISNERKYNVFHPSAWGSCLRCVAYHFYNQRHQFLRKADSDVDVRMERIFDTGHNMHSRWQEYLSAAGVLRGSWTCNACGMAYGSSERLGILSPKVVDQRWACDCGNRERLDYGEVLVRSEPQYNFEGHVDAIVDLRGTAFGNGCDSDLFVVDFKTIKDDYFSELRHAKHEHVVQVHIYMWLLDLKAAVVLYENKDDQNVKEMFVPRDDSLIERVKEESLWLVEVLKHGKLPQRPTGHSRSKPPCRFCEFQTLCYA